MEGFLRARVICELSCAVAAVGDTLPATGSDLMPAFSRLPSAVHGGCDLATGTAHICAHSTLHHDQFIQLGLMLYPGTEAAMMQR
jgi:hypothetical protein